MVAFFAKCRIIARENRARSSTFYEEEEKMALTVTEWTAGTQTALPLGRDPEPEFELVGTTTESATFSVDHLKKWLGDLDSNQDSQIQNLESYRWTISHPLRRKTSRCTVWGNNAATTLHIQFSRDSRNRQPTGSCKSYSFGSTGAL